MWKYNTKGTHKNALFNLKFINRYKIIPIIDLKSHILFHVA